MDIWKKKATLTTIVCYRMVLAINDASFYNRKSYFTLRNMGTTFYKINFYCFFHRLEFPEPPSCGFWGS